MEGKKRRNQIIGDIVGLILTAVIFLIPFYFMFVQSIKSKKEANRLSIAWPTELHFENYLEVIKHGNYQLVTAFKNSAILTVFTVLGLIVTGAMAGYVIQRRKGKLMTTIQSVIMLGLMIPASILPTIRMLQSMGIYKTMFSMVMIEIALQTPFTIMLYRGFMSSIPVDLEEAASIDGCNRWQIFQKVIFPLLKPIQATIIILVGVQTFNDFTNPLYFLPGAENDTADGMRKIFSPADKRMIFKGEKSLTLKKKSNYILYHNYTQNTSGKEKKEDFSI